MLPTYICGYLQKHNNVVCFQCAKGISFVNSVAILIYLASFSTQDHWYPENRRQRALVDEYMAWQHTGLRKHGMALFIQQV